jgi:uncharacterized protein YdcH (DUF465 family)
MDEKEKRPAAAVGVEDTELRKLEEDRTRYDARLDELQSAPYPSADQQMEECRLKKLKLQAKDRLEDLRRGPARLAV